MGFILVFNNLFTWKLNKEFLLDLELSNFFALKGICIMMFISLLFTLGLAGIVCNKKNIIKFMACIELILVAASLQFVFSSVLFENVLGQVYAIMILAIGASEAAIGLGLIIAAHRSSGFIVFQKYNILKG